MLFMLFMIFGAFDVVVQHPCRLEDHIGRIISFRPPILGTLHIRSAASSCTVAAIAPAAASLSFSLSSIAMHPIRLNNFCAAAASLSSSSLLMTKRIQIHSIFAFSGIFVICSVVDDDERYKFIQFVSSAASLSFALSLMIMKPIQFNHVGNQRGLPNIGLLQSGDQPQSLSIA